MTIMKEQITKTKLKSHTVKVYHKVNDLAQKAHAHRVIIKDHKHKEFLHFPMTLGIAIAVILPIIAGLGLAAFLINDWKAAVEKIEQQETP